MQLTQLRQFCHLAECENMSECARNLFISQPALSRSLASLEQELGIFLFDRAGRGLRLNAAGTFYYRQVSRALELIDGAAAQLYKQAQQDAHTAALNLFTTPPNFSQLMTGFSAKHPEVTVHTTRTPFEEAYFDLAIGISPQDTAEYISTPFFKDELVVTVNKTHPWASRSTISPIELQGQPLVLPRPGRFSMYAHIEQLYAEHGMPLNVAAWSPASLTTKTLIESGAGIGFFPRSLLETVFQHDLHLLSLEGTALYQTLYLLQHRNATSPGVQALADYILSFYA